MQFDPIKPTLKAPGTQRLKLKYDKLLSYRLNFASILPQFCLHSAFKFNLRRYNVSDGGSSVGDGTSGFSGSKDGSSRDGGSKMGGSEASSAALASNVDTNALDDIATVRKAGACTRSR